MAKIKKKKVVESKKEHAKRLIEIVKYHLPKLTQEFTGFKNSDPKGGE